MCRRAYFDRCKRDTLMNLHKKLMLCALAAIFALGGVSCSLWGSSADPSDTQAAQATNNEKAAPQSQPAAAASQDVVKADLDKVAAKLVGMAADNVTPKKSRMTAVKLGKEYVAKYAEVDRSSVNTTMQAGQKGQYVGFVRYLERHYECRGKSKADALKAKDCTVVTTRRMNEMVRYDGKKWNY